MKKHTELLTIPAALLLMMGYNMVANWFGLHTMTWEQVGKVFPAFVIFLIVTGFIRLAHTILFPVLYKYIDPSFEENKEWKLLSEKEKFIYSFWLHLVLLVLFGLIVQGL
jgi:hypothetical protein